MTTMQSAVSCLADAEALMASGDETGAKRWAARSLAYSVGILHPDHRAAVA